MHALPERSWLVRDRGVETTRFWPVALEAACWFWAFSWLTPPCALRRSTLALASICAYGVANGRCAYRLALWAVTMLAGVDWADDGALGLLTMLRASSEVDRRARSFALWRCADRFTDFVTILRAACPSTLWMAILWGSCAIEGRLRVHEIARRQRIAKSTVRHGLAAVRSLSYTSKKLHSTRRHRHRGARDRGSKQEAA